MVLTQHFAFVCMSLSNFYYRNFFYFLFSFFFENSRFRKYTLLFSTSKTLTQAAAKSYTTNFYLFQQLERKRKILLC